MCYKNLRMKNAFLLADMENASKAHIHSHNLFRVTLHILLVPYLYLSYGL